ncbi:MAG TPA: arsenic resistance N-acetyltransferase ArsN2 [Gemmatimonadaceae bacterium]|jgi:amino-acid N-acetyltransferase
MTITTGSTVPTIRPAVDGDLRRVLALLEASALPTVGIAEGLCSLIVAEHDGAIVGVVGLEARSDRYALLRSTAVDEAWRGKGLGRRLVERAIAQALVRGVDALYLLTTTAETYFPSFGFTPVARDTVPEELRATEEFTGACPASATVMSLCLTETRA